MSDRLPDGRVDHRGHQRDVDWSGWGWTCLDCGTESDDVPWTIPYDVNGRPMPEDWRGLPATEVALLCGLGSAS